MKDKSYSALSNAALRAAESYYPEDERLFYDGAAFYLMPPLWKLFLKLIKFSPLREMIFAKRDKELPGVIGNLLYRTRYIDDTLRENLKEMEQLLILGAGFDTRSIRIEGLENLEVFEVDHPETLSKKKKGLKKLYQDLPEYLNLVEIDFEKRDLNEVLQENNFDKNKKTFLIWEGVTQYLEREAVDKVIDYFAELKSGSRVVFSYVKKEVVVGSERSEVDEKIISFVEEMGSPWKTGLKSSEIEEILNSRGLELIEDVGKDEYQKLYSDLSSREISIYDGERIVYAVKD
ncbi:class I SAM-dependent methyltransferase [Halanaerobium kushneri]|uniref:S-adenosyl-L-methionine-dependent methyltransferase n=1 Tax=Halanaerobium kushneri TaxID=56779 RepID=A0A1N7BAI7_9FIRM|nr:SAM-dependent methyltransferase [Halanaerobium kushneri]SIR48292.1 methyltransferase, TIGR00027 family [Halanaerobium kushneri]